jgi:hypothetical protein
VPYKTVEPFTEAMTRDRLTCSSMYGSFLDPVNRLRAGPPVALLEIDDAAASMHVSLNLVQDFGETAAKQIRYDAEADATEAY